MVIGVHRMEFEEGACIAKVTKGEIPLDPVKGASKNSNPARTCHHNSLILMTIIFLRNVGKRIFRDSLKVTLLKELHQSSVPEG